MKKKISIIGFGYNVKKNIIPAIKKSKKLEIDKIFLKNNKFINKNFKKYNFQSINNLKNIKKKSWFYISTPISSHYSIVKKLINLDANIICEKPLTDSSLKTKILLNLLKSKPKINLIEVEMYKFHKFYSYFKKIIKKNMKKIINIDLIFKVPDIDKKNSIYTKKKSGGALLSLGFYPVSTAIDILGYPKNIISNIKFSSNKNIDIEGNFCFNYRKIVCNGYWALGSNYENKARVLFKNKTSFVFNMFYAKNEFVNCSVNQINSKNKIIKNFKIGKDNQFLNMITNCIYNKKKKHNISNSNLQVIKLLEVIKKNS
jgi:predicted dehydrogenase